MSEVVRTRTAQAPQRNTSEIIKLDFPIEVGGISTDRLTMRRPKVRDRLLIDQQNPNATDAEREIRLFANLCEVTTDDLEGLDWADYNKLAKVFTSFTASSPSKT